MTSDLDDVAVQSKSPPSEGLTDPQLTSSMCRVHRGSERLLKQEEAVVLETRHHHAGRTPRPEPQGRMATERRTAMERRTATRIFKSLCV